MKRFILLIERQIICFQKVWWILASYDSNFISEVCLTAILFVQEHEKAQSALVLRNVRDLSFAVPLQGSTTLFLHSTEDTKLQTAPITLHCSLHYQLMT